MQAIVVSYTVVLFATIGKTLFRTHSVAYKNPALILPYNAGQIYKNDAELPKI